MRRPARMLIQNLRLTPCGFDSQYVTGWRIGVDIDTMLRQNEDEHGNIVSSFSHHGAPVERLTVSASGEIETSDAAGVMRGTVERLPPDMYLRESRLAHVNGALRAFAKEATAGAADPLDAPASADGRTSSGDGVRPVQAGRSGIGGRSLRAAPRPGARLRPYLHRLRALSRIPGALHLRLSRGRRGRAASPARTPGRRPIAPKLGWVAFDATACLCADDRYVRVVVGFDAQDSAFVRGSHGGGEDAVETAIRVEQAGFQTQA